MNQGRILAFAVCYGVLAGFLLMPAIGHMVSLWSGADRHALVLRLGAVAWIVLILLSAWTGHRIAASIGDPRLARRATVRTALALLGSVGGIIVADAVFSVVMLIGGDSIRLPRTHMQIILALAWLTCGTVGAVLLTRLTRCLIRTGSI